MDLAAEVSPELGVALRLYAAFEQHDAKALMDLLHPSFTGYVSEGMPFGVGGFISSPAAMMNVWGTIGARFDVRPVVDELVSAGDARIFGIGRYRGTRRDGHPLDAAFVHMMEIRDGKIASLRQVTDTSRWGGA